MNDKAVELLKASGAGGLGVVLFVMMLNLQTTMNEQSNMMSDQKEALTKLITDIDKRVVALEVKEREGYRYVRQSSN
ncbi:hypothetical protein BEL05_04870 [Shewanella colwelliana]|uniref:Uncharacterized protein n=1 Tax=Shewanella colwelliana TaxID=23 RepID=A0A1E5IQT4_SHECO|nr:hypothetical protein [Shewanella colwelliana]OEG72313.1 hypothetical protein BEL05_04870 [Shewanella colwelliana]